MLQKMRGNNKGFTLIELMIVIAIIGILAAIAIPNFISYRNKSFCSRAESDANNVAAALSDYFADPSHFTYPATTTSLFQPTSGNTYTVSGPTNAIVITVSDGSGRCPSEYRSNNSASGWATGTTVQFTKLMND